MRSYPDVIEYELTRGDETIDLIIAYDVHGAEPDVGIMREYAEIMSIKRADAYAKDSPQFETTSEEDDRILEFIHDNLD